VDLRGVIRYVQRTCGNFSTHLPFASSNLFFKPTHYDLIDSFNLPIPLWVCRDGVSI